MGVSDEIEFLRVFGVASIVLSHLGNNHMSLHPVLDFAGYGNFGLFCFLFASGLALTLRYRDTFAGRIELDGFWRYLLRRILRVAPMFVLVLLVTAILLPHLLNNPAPGALFWMAVFVEPAAGGFWVMHYQIQLYFLFPFLVFILGPLIARFPLALALLFFVYFIYALINRDSHVDPVVTLNVHRYAVVFVVSIFFGLYLKDIRAWFAQWAGGNLAAALTTISLVMMLSINPAYFSELVSLMVGTWPPAAELARGGTPYFDDRYLLSAGLLGFFVLVSSDSAGWSKRVIGNVVVRFLGRISYAAFLIHLPVLEFVHMTFGEGALNGAIVIGATILLSWMCTVVIDRPIRQFCRV